MKVKKILLNSIVVLMCIALLPVLILFGYTEYKLREFPVTDLGDTAGVFAVNTGSPYYVVSASEGGVFNFDERTDVSHNVSQVVMAKYLHNFDVEYLAEIGCVEVERMGAVGYYEAPNGLRFVVTRGYRASRLFCTFTIEGATMEEIEADG